MPLVRASASSDRDALRELKVNSRTVIVVFVKGKEFGRLTWVTDASEIRALMEKAVAQAGG